MVDIKGINSNRHGNPLNTHNALLGSIIEERNWSVKVPMKGLQAHNLQASIENGFLTVECQVSYTSGRILKRNVKWTKKLRIPENVDTKTVEANLNDTLLIIEGKLL